MNANSRQYKNIEISKECYSIHSCLTLKKTCLSIRVCLVGSSDNSRIFWHRAQTAFGVSCAVGAIRALSLAMGGASAPTILISFTCRKNASAAHDPPIVDSLAPPLSLRRFVSISFE
jgi:hypothetical protein